MINTFLMEKRLHDHAKLTLAKQKEVNWKHWKNAKSVSMINNYKSRIEKFVVDVILLENTL